MKHLDDEGLWMHSSNYTGMHHSPAVLEAGGSEQSKFICSPAPAICAPAHNALPPSSLSRFLEALFACSLDASFIPTVYT